MKYGWLSKEPVVSLDLQNKLRDLDIGVFIVILIDKYNSAKILFKNQIYFTFL